MLLDYPDELPELVGLTDIAREQRAARAPDRPDAPGVSADRQPGRAVSGPEHRTRVVLHVDTGLFERLPPATASPIADFTPRNWAAARAR